MTDSVIMKKFEYMSESIELLMKRIEMIEKNIKSLYGTQEILVRLVRDTLIVLDGGNKE